MKRRTEEATTMVSIGDKGGDDSGGNRITGNSGTTGAGGLKDVRPDRGTISVPRLPRRRRPVYLEGDDFRVAQRPAAERRHRPL